MKRFFSLVLIVVLLFSFSSCGEDKNISSSDKKAVESGSDFSNYVGMWSESDISYEKGGLILNISITNTKMNIDCSSTSSGPYSRVAEISKSIDLSQIKDNSVGISYDDDGWGNSGVLELTFNDGYILADFKNVIMDEMANWGFYECTYKLVNNDKAQEILSQGSNDYYENNPIEITPTYDTSKASGILASLGMTEQEFKNNCYNMQKVTSLATITTGDTFFRKEKYTIQDFDLLNRMSDYPSDYINLNYKIVFDVNGKSFNEEGIPYYTGKLFNTTILFYDRRDDVQSPNVSTGDEVCAYGVFTGCHSFENGHDYLSFVLIALEK